MPGNFFKDFEGFLFGGRQSAPPNQVPKPDTPTGRRMANLDTTFAWLSRALKSQDPTGLNALDLTAINPVVDAIQEGFAIGEFVTAPGTGIFQFTAASGANILAGLIPVGVDRARRVLGFRYIASISAAGPSIIGVFKQNGGPGATYFIGDNTVAQDLPTRTFLTVPLYVPPGYGLFFSHPGFAGGESVNIQILYVDAPAGCKLGM